MRRPQIPFNKPFVIGRELYYISESVISGKISGDGIFSQKCSRFFEEKFNACQVLMTTSCTMALEMAAILCDIKEGDEIILPSYTFVSTANAFYLRGAKLVFAEIRSDTLNIDETKIESLINEKTKAIVPVHYAGISCEMDVIMEISRKYDLHVIEDAAQGVNAKYKDKYLGTIGDLGTYSFHETKNFICGEGGALITNNSSFRERAEIIREKGTNRSQFFRGEIDKYTWVDIGSSYLPSDILAAFLYAQLEHIEEITLKRKKIFALYEEILTPLMEIGHIRLPVIPSYCETNYHMFYIILNNLENRTLLIEHLKEKGIMAVFHYVPLHTSPIGKKIGYKESMFPITERISDTLLRLPFYYELSVDEIAYICDSIYEFFRKIYRKNSSIESIN